MPEVLSIIPARGGSRGIPRKNLHPLLGKPLIAYAIEDAKACADISRVLVSTEDKEIAEVAKRYGAEVPFFRPASLAQDETPDFPVFQHALQWLSQQEGYQPDLVVHLRPTNPVRSVKTLERAIAAMLSDPEVDALRSVSWPAQTPYKMWKISGRYLQPLLEVPGLPESFSQPRQRLPEVFWQNGYVDIIRSRTILELQSMTGKKIVPFIIQEQFVEIDYPESLQVAERLLINRRDGQLSPVSQTLRHPS